MSEPLATANELHALASQVTGLDDFGPDDYTDGLEVLLGSLEREADLTARGRKVMRAMLRGALAARLVSEAGWAAHPAYAQVRRRAAAVRHRAAQDRHHRAAPAAHRGPGAPGPGAVAGRGAAAPAAAADLGG